MVIREMKIVYGEKKTAPAKDLKMDSPSKVAGFLSDMAEETQEVFCVVYLNNKNKMLGYTETSRGTISETLVHPREIFKGAILANAAGIVVAHNHPSGQVEPSREDITATTRLLQAGHLLGIPVLDHVILGGNAYYSMKEHGHI